VKTPLEAHSWQGLDDLRGGLRAVLMRRLPDENEVEDVIQETYLRAVRYRGRLQDGRRLRSWTTRIALNVLSDKKRREGRFLATDPADQVLERDAEGGAPAPLEPAVNLGRWELERERALMLLARARTRLRESDRRVLDSFYGGAGSCRATAEECGIPAHLVKVRLFRARRRLSRAMRRELVREPDCWGASLS
jgi:RNA polymerase sigma factor (sigma-70 family)